MFEPTPTAIKDTLLNLTAAVCAIVELLEKKGIVTPEDGLMRTLMPKHLAALDQGLQAAEEKAMGDLAKQFPKIAEILKKLREMEEGPL